MPASRSLLSGFSCGFGARWAAGAWLAGALSGCTLVTDIDRERIPQPPTPVFPEVDAGPIPPPHPAPDASAPDAANPGEPDEGGPSDAGDAAVDTDAGNSPAPGDAG